jgi:hypothetical protein
MNHFDDFDKRWDQHNKTIRRFGALAAFLWLFYILLVLGLVGLGIWGFIELVQWVTAQ